MPLTFLKLGVSMKNNNMPLLAMLFYPDEERCTVYQNMIP